MIALCLLCIMQCASSVVNNLLNVGLGPEVIKFFILNYAEHEIYPAHKC